VGCSLCTCRCLEGRRKRETRARSLTSCGVVRRWAHNVHVNSPPKSGPKLRRSAVSFCRLFFTTRPCLIRFDRNRLSRLHDAETLGGSSLQIRASTTEVEYRTITSHQCIRSLAHPPLRRQDFFIPFVDVHLRSGEQVSRTVVLSDPASGEGE
jgi:hypothetical protein